MNGFLETNRFPMNRNKSLLQLKVLVIWALAVSLFSCNLDKNEQNCNQFKQGRFVYNLRNQNGQIDRKFSIIRNDSIQTETDVKSGEFSKLSIKWTSDCNYELKLIETTFIFPESLQKMRKTVPLKTTILVSTDRYYVFKAKRDNYNFVMTDTIWVEK